MKQTILSGRSVRSVRTALTLRIALCVLLSVLTLGLNVYFLMTFTDTTYGPYLAGTIVSDILCGTFLVFYSGVFLFPQHRLYRLACRKTNVVCGTVQRISPDTVRYLDMDCLAVTLDTQQLFLPAHTMTLREGAAYQLKTVAKVIVEAAQ